MGWRDAFPLFSRPLPDGRGRRADVLAGLAVGLTVIPQGVAYAGLAGMPPITGIYACLLPVLVAALLGDSPRVATGATALTAMLVSASLAGLALPQSADWVSLAVWLSVLAGLLQLALGLARSGWLVHLVSAPVLIAFTQASAVVIIVSQLPVMLGHPGSWQTLGSSLQWHGPTLAFAVLSFALLLALRRVTPLLPAVLLVMLGAAVVSRAAGFEGLGGRVIGDLPTTLLALSWPAWPGWEALSDLLLPALVIALVSFLETASSAGEDHRRAGTSWNADRDLRAQGAAKLAAALSGTFPSSASFSRSALNLQAGAQSAWSGVVSVLIVLLALWALAPLLRDVPSGVLGAIVSASVVGLLRPRELLGVWRVSRVEGLIAATTFLATLATAPRVYWGVVLGIVLSLVHFLYRRLHPRIIEVGLHPDGRLRDRHVWKLDALAPHTLALRLDAALDFGSAHALEGRIESELAQHPNTRCVVLLAQPINSIDATGVLIFQRLRQRLAARGVAWWVVGLKLPVERVLGQAGALNPTDRFACFVADEAMVDALSRLAPAAQGVPADNRP